MSNHIQIALVAILFFIAGIFTSSIFNNMSTTKHDHCAENAHKYKNQIFNDYRLPKSLKLCDEPIPLEDRRVHEMLDREFNITVWDRAQVIMYLKRAGRYFSFIEKKLFEAQLPDDLKYLAVAESALITRSISNKGARGPWQFMTIAARSNGLRKNRIIDERYNFELSTEAAIKNLKRLKTRFGTWSLALAAYNGGETRLAKAIKNQKTNNYYRLNLPIETERYNFRIAAIKIIMENPEKYGYRISSENIYKPIENDVVKIKAETSIEIMDIASYLNSDFKEIKELNPQFLKDHIPAGIHIINVPLGQGVKMVLFQKKYPNKLSRVSVQVSHKKKVIAR